METKKEPIPLKRKTTDSHQSPPPAQQAYSQINDMMIERFSVYKEACNDSSLLFQENQNVKQLTSEGSKMTAWNSSEIETYSIKPTNININDNFNYIIKNYKNIETEETPFYEPITRNDYYKLIDKHAENVKKVQDAKNKNKAIFKSSKNLEVEEIKADKPKLKEEIKPIDYPPHKEAVKKTKVAPVADYILTLGDYCEPLIKINNDKKLTETKKNKVESKETKPLDEIKWLIPLEQETGIPKPFGKHSLPTKTLFSREVQDIVDWETFNDDDFVDNFLTIPEIEERTKKVRKCRTNEKRHDDDIKEKAEEDLQMIKTGRIDKATQQSHANAKSLVLPSAARPKTSTATARRFIARALGLKLPVIPEERATEMKSLRQARD